MKQTILIFLSCLALSSCFSDESSVGNLAGFEDIDITGIEKEYLVTSYVGEYIDIKPSIKTNIPDNELEERWMIAKNTGYANNTDEKKDTFQLIGTERNLHYNVNLSPGTYTLKYEVSERNGYTAFGQSTITVTTAFLNSIYVLKETTDGDTDLDYLTVKGKMTENVLSTNALANNPLKGKPRYMSVAYAHSFYDENAKYTSGTLLCISTESGNFKVVRANDFTVQFDRKDICYQPLDEDERPYGIWLNRFAELFLTNKGMHWNYSADVSPSTGKYGVIDLPSGSSPYWVYAPALGAYMVYWDEPDGRFFYTNINGMTKVIADEAGNPIDFSSYTCVGAGCNYIKGTGVFVLQNKATGIRTFFSIESRSSIKKLCEIPAGNITSRCPHLSFNANQATLAYGTDGKDIYAVDFTTGAERKLNVQGLSQGSTITYVSDVYFKGSSAEVDYLAIGTESGGKYTVSFYNMVGGTPDGAPALTMSGTGKIHSIRYVAPSASGFSDKWATTD